jgi:hypothetical protein
MTNTVKVAPRFDVRLGGRCSAALPRGAEDPDPEEEDPDDAA